MYFQPQLSWFVELEYTVPKTDEANSIVIEFGFASIATLLLGPEAGLYVVAWKGEYRGNRWLLFP